MEPNEPESASSAPNDDDDDDFSGGSLGAFAENYWAGVLRRAEQIQARILERLDHEDSDPDNRDPDDPEPVLADDYWDVVRDRADQIRGRILERLNQEVPNVDDALPRWNDDEWVAFLADATASHRLEEVDLVDAQSRHERASAREEEPTNIRHGGTDERYRTRRNFVYTVGTPAAVATVIALGWIPPSLVPPFAGLLGLGFVLSVVHLCRRAASNRFRSWLAPRRTRPLTCQRALRLVADHATSVLDTQSGRTATGLNIAVSRAIWNAIEPGLAVQRVRNAALEVNPPHPHAVALLVRLVPSSKLADRTVLVTTLRKTSSVGTRLLGYSDVPAAAKGTVEMIPLVEHIGRFVLPPNVTLMLGREGDLAIPPQSASHYGVSRLHVALTNIDGVVEFSDLDSTNGVYLNGRRIISSDVAEPGDELACGNARWLIAERRLQASGHVAKGQR